MATLDVADVTTCTEFADNFDVLRRPEQISQFGRMTLGPETRATQVGTIYPTGDNSLVRQEDFQRGAKTLTIVTPYRLRTGGPGYQPDFVMYRSVVYVVRSVEDFSQYGAGFVTAECSSIESIETPPQ